MTTFAIVHGAYHCGAHFDLLAAELRSRSHQVIAPDLPITAPGVGAAGYARVLADAVGSAQDVVVIGHSMGGLTAPVAASMIPATRALVYLTALVPHPGISFNDAASAEPELFAWEPQAGPRAHPDGSASSHPAHACEMWYHDCGWQTAQWACSLLRPQHWLPVQEITPLEDHPAIPTTFILGTADRVLNPKAMRRIAEKQLDANLIEMDAGHSAYLSKPAELADILLSS